MVPVHLIIGNKTVFDNERSTTELHPRTTLNIALCYYMDECVFKHGRLKICVYVSLLSFRWFSTEQ
jgi:hypothetical protein